MKEPASIQNALEKNIKEQFKTIIIIFYFGKVCTNVIVKGTS